MLPIANTLCHTTKICKDFEISVDVIGQRLDTPHDDRLTFGNENLEE